MEERASPAGSTDASCCRPHGAWFTGSSLLRWTSTRRGERRRREGGQSRAARLQKKKKREHPKLASAVTNCKAFGSLSLSPLALPPLLSLLLSPQKSVNGPRCPLDSDNGFVVVVSGASVRRRNPKRQQLARQACCHRRSSSGRHRRSDYLRHHGRSRDPEVPRAEGGRRRGE